MKIGFTGTQHGMTEAQQAAVFDEVVFVNDDVSPQDEFHHGMCIGSDKQFHDIVRIWSNAPIAGHPPINKSKVADCDCDMLWPEKEYLERNHDIVDATERMLGAPQFMFEEQRSGTWATIRYARSLRRPLSICWPDGTVTRENWQT